MAASHEQQWRNGVCPKYYRAGKSPREIHRSVLSDDVYALKVFSVLIVRGWFNAHIQQFENIAGKVVPLWTLNIFLRWRWNV